MLHFASYFLAQPLICSVHVVFGYRPVSVFWRKDILFLKWSMIQPSSLSERSEPLLLCLEHSWHQTYAYSIEIGWETCWKQSTIGARDRNIDTPSKRRGWRVTREQMMLPQARSAREGELYVWFLCSCTSLAFERRFLEILERADHFYAWQLGDWLRIALARLQIDQLAS